MEIGTDEWWTCKSVWHPRGIAEVILRLLEQGEIGRVEAHDLLKAACDYPLTGAKCPPAPWDKLNWCDGSDPVPAPEKEDRPPKCRYWARESGEYCPVGFGPAIYDPVGCSATRLKCDGLPPCRLEPSVYEPTTEPGEGR